MVSGVRIENFRSSLSSRYAVMAQCNESENCMSAFNELSRGINAGRLPTGQLAYTVKAFSPS